MRSCDLCSSAVIARAAFLGERADRRIWLCVGCHDRFSEHELYPDELLALARLALRRAGKCDWCAEELPAAQVRVPGADGRTFAFQLCATCARDASENSAGQVLHGQAALAGDTTTDPRYEKELEVRKRRRAIHRVK
ncbi:hypothetical protein K2Z84_14915 [Candidatus Binatia bacterium]|nr:hypothetical protein [Candidatus Binatia bacterium]